MKCPGSLILEEKCPQQEYSPYAAEGTAAHEVAAQCLRSGDNADTFVGEKIEGGDRKFKVDEDMASNIQLYLDTIRADMEEDGIPHSELLVEEGFELLDISNMLYGTTDAAFISPFGKLRVYDLKYGRGTYVDVEDNPQLLIYALGAWKASGKMTDGIELVIVQPRFPGEEPVRRCVYSAEQMLKFEKELRLAVGRVHDGDTSLKTGSWCKFCPAVSICDAKHKEVFAIVPAGNKLPEPAALSIEQMVKVLQASEAIADWAAAVHAHAESLAKTGLEIPGYKLVQKRGNRRWIDEAAVETAFVDQGDDIYEKKLKSPAKLEKVVGKEAIQEYVEIPDNGTQLVPNSAKGEPIQANAAQVFEKLS
jgi:hypothetical protein